MSPFQENVWSWGYQPPHLWQDIIHTTNVGSDRFWYTVVIFLILKCKLVLAIEGVTVFLILSFILGYPQNRISNLRQELFALETLLEEFERCVCKQKEKLKHLKVNWRLVVFAAYASVKSVMHADALYLNLFCCAPDTISTKPSIGCSYFFKIWISRVLAQ